jgi:hypothetical protein
VAAGSRKAVARRRKAHSLPTFPPNHYSYPEDAAAEGAQHVRPSAEAIQALAAAHGFPTSFDLVEELHERWFWWRADVSMGRTPAASAQKRYLRELSARAAALEEALRTLPDTLHDELMDVGGGPERLNLAALRWQAYQLWVNAWAAAGRLTPSRAGAPGDPALLQLIVKLRRMYCAAFGPNAPRLSKSDRYGGKFFTFVESVLALFGVEKSNAALGRLIARALKDIDRRDKGVSSKSPSK